MSLHLFLPPPVPPLLASYSRYPLSYLLIPSSLCVDKAIIQYCSSEARKSFPGKFIHPNFTSRVRRDELISIFILPSIH